MTSTTEILRRLLDERGVWWDYGIAGPTTTRFTVNGVDLTFTPMRDGLVCSTILTPEQAIAATLGTVTCHIEERHGDWFCTGCGELVGTCDTTSELCMDGNAIELWNYCPNCGRRIEQ